MSDGARDLLVRGIAAAKTGDRGEVRQRALRMTGEKLTAGSGGVQLSLRSARMVVTSYGLALAPVWLADVRFGETRRLLVVSGVTARVFSEERPPGRFTD